MRRLVVGGRMSGWWLAVALAVFTSTVMSAQSKGYTAPRTPWGDPDLQGTYTNSNESGIPLARPAQFAGRRPDQVTPEEMAKLMEQRAARIEETAEIIGATNDNNTGAGPPHWYENFKPKNSRPWMIADAPDYQVPPLTQEARDRAARVRAARRGGDGYYRGPFDGPEDFTLYVRCITRGVPGSMMPAIYGNSYDITQGPGVVTIRYEMVHEARVIPLDGRAHVSSAIKSYMGDARGHFEGDTLVVETTNFLEKSATNGASEQLKLTERFKPTGPNTIDWSVTLEDPRTWTKPWTYGMQLTKDPQSQLFEYACHEGNEGMRGMLKAERLKEKEGAN
jgi:hypothetical protein